jgi:chromosome segregation ATPase
MKKIVIAVAVSTVCAFCTMAENLRAAKAAHRLTDEQLFEVIKKAPSGTSVTVPADFFRDVIAGKYRWRNATNWIHRASGDATMVKALESMQEDIEKAIKDRENSYSYTNGLNRQIANLKSRIESKDAEWRREYAVATNTTAQVKVQFRKAIEDLLQTRTREKDAVAKFYEFRDKFEAVDAKLSKVKADIVAKREEVQEKYDDATFITKSIYKFFLDVIDAVAKDLEDDAADVETEEKAK